MSKCYLWDEKKKEVIVTERLFHEEAKDHGYQNMLCVDEVHSGATSRYGKFEEPHGWIYVPLCNFPAEFRTWLLIMEVP